MKAMLAVLGLILSIEAHAGARCGDTMREVAQIINQQYRELNAGEIVACFKGNWGYGLVLTMDEPLNFGGNQFEACPQSSGAIVLRKKNGGNVGKIVCQDGYMQASGFTNDMAMANGTWTKQSTAVASGRHNRN